MIQENINTFLTHLESFGYTIPSLGFSAGATDVQIQELETVISRPLPDDYKSFLKRINGQNNENFIFLPENSLLMSTNSIIEEYKGQMDYFEDTAEFKDQFQYSDKIRCTVWSESRIPIAGKDGYFAFVDLDPGPKGTVGQIIYLINECDFIVLATSFHDLLSKYNKCFDRKILSIREIMEGESKILRVTTNDSDFLDGNALVEIFNSTSG